MRTAEVAIRRELAVVLPDQYRPDLARSLSNLGVTSSELGRPADALPVEQEAVAIHRELAAVLPDRSTAMALRPFTLGSSGGRNAGSSTMGRSTSSVCCILIQ